MTWNLQLLLVGGFLLLIGCAQTGEVGSVAVSPYRAAELVAGDAAAPPGEGRYGIAGRSSASRAEERQGLATQLGGTRRAPVNRVAFFRKRSEVPDAIDQFYYNDREGARAMAERLGGGIGRERGGQIDLASGRLRVALLDRRGGRAYRHIAIGDEVCVVGELGREYVIWLENRGGVRLEIVVSVDGLDVLSGRAASVRGRGYVVEAGSQLAIEGLRESESQVRIFRFSDVASSEAASRGEKQARSVGVIGVAVYEEDEVAALRALREEGQRRLGAEAFPR
jgi:hypothetical protein